MRSVGIVSTVEAPANLAFQKRLSRASNAFQGLGGGLHWERGEHGECRARGAKGLGSEGCLRRKGRPWGASEPQERRRLGSEATLDLKGSLGYRDRVSTF